MNEKVLVFGGSGFIGRYIVKDLESRGCFDVLSVDINSYQHVKSNHIFCDINDADNVQGIVNDFDPDYVYNLAGFASLDKSHCDPKKVINLNIMGNLNILESLNLTKLKRFVYASSAYAVGRSGSFYGLSKACSEKLVELYESNGGLKSTILRYGSVYGSDDCENNYMFHLINSVIRTGTIDHESNGDEVREYIHVADAARLSVDVLFSEDFVNKNIIITGQERITRKELFEIIREICNKPVNIKLKDKDIKDRYRLSPYNFSPSSCVKLTANPFTDLGQGLYDCMASISEKQKNIDEIHK